MFNIATRTEESLNYKEILSKRRDQVGMTITDAIGQSVAHTAINLSAGLSLRLQKAAIRRV